MLFKSQRHWATPYYFWSSCFWCIKIAFKSFDVLCLAVSSISRIITKLHSLFSEVDRLFCLHALLQNPKVQVLQDMFRLTGVAARMSAAARSSQKTRYALSLCLAEQGRSACTICPAHLNRTEIQDTAMPWLLRNVFEAVGWRIMSSGFAVEAVQCKTEEICVSNRVRISYM